MTEVAMRRPALSEAAKLELQNLAAAGDLSPRTTVERARDPGSPLHPYFPWDDAVAAQERREDIARAIIRSVRIEMTVHERTFDVPKYVHDPSTRDQGYVATVTLRDDRELAMAAVRREFSRAAAVDITLNVDEIAIALMGLSTPRVDEVAPAQIDQPAVE